MKTNHIVVTGAYASDVCRPVPYVVGVDYFTYRFEGEVVYHFVGTYRYTVVFLPDDLRVELPLERYPRLRIAGEVGEMPVEGAWQPVEGRWYLMLSKAVLRGAPARVGDVIEVRFNVVDQDEVEIPADLAAALAQNETASERWQALTVGKRRGLAHLVASAKRPETRSARVATAIDRLLHPETYTRTGKKISSS